MKPSSRRVGNERRDHDYIEEIRDFVICITLAWSTERREARNGRGGGEILGWDGDAREDVSLR
jgi:hypothetical protein